MSEQKGPQQLCLDGNTAVALSAYKLIDTAFCFPITPSSVMPENIEMYSAQGKLNAFNNVVTVRQTQSELGAAAACHGASKAGSLAATFTSSQGLLLMIPNLYFLGNCHCPAVIHLACRSVGMSSTSLSPDHSDIYAVSNTGICAINARNVQECHDMAICTHLAAIEAQQCFVHFFEGFRVSHQFETFYEVDMETVKKMIDFDKLTQWRRSPGVISCEDPQGMGCGMGPEFYYQTTEAQKYHFRNVSGVVQEVFKKFEKYTGRHYEIMEYTGAPDAEKVIVIMGSAALTTELVIKNLVQQYGQKVGVISIRLWRPFDASYFVKLLPKTCRKIVICDRTREHTTNGDQLYKECLASIFQHHMIEQFEVIKNATYGICGIDLQPIDVLQMLEDLDNKETTSMRVGVNDDEPDCIFHRQLKFNPQLQLFSKETMQTLCYSLGSDGSIGMCRNLLKILSDVRPEVKSQGNFVFDGKKSGGLVQIHLRLSPEEIHAQYDVTEADYLAIHQESYLEKYPEMLKYIKQQGTVFINCSLTPEQLPAFMKRQIAQKNLKLVMFDCNKLASELGIPGRISMITGVFFMKYAFHGMIEPVDGSERMKQQARITYAKQSAEVIQANMNAVDRTLQAVDQCEVKYDRDQWLVAEDPVKEKHAVKLPELMQEGNTYDKIIKAQYSSVTAKECIRFTNGAFPAGYAKYEKPGTAEQVAHWNSQDCIACNQCAVMCPHACIRPFILSEEQAQKYEHKKAKEGHFRIQISPADCKGCQVCTKVCPKKCISMAPYSQEHKEQQQIWDELVENNQNPEVDTETCNIRELQFAEPYLFSNGACPGCAEPVIGRMLSQVYGSTLQQANAVGCCLLIEQYNILRSAMVDKDGHGPAVSTSAFEDNAMYGMGNYYGNVTLRNNLKNYIQKNIESVECQQLKEALQNWLDNFNNRKNTYKYAKAVREALEKVQDGELKRHLIQMDKFLPVQTHWIVGGDGWTMIEGNGVEHALVQNANIKILVYNNQCFANTGGQWSWQTPTMAVTKHAYMGVDTLMKKTCEMFMMNRHAYVAQIAVGANMAQALKTIREANEFDGPAFVMCYCPCLQNTIQQQKLAVECGAWNLFRFNPHNEPGKRLMLDSKKTKDTIDEYIGNEQRFMSLEKKNKERFDRLKAKLQEDINEDWILLQKLQQE